MNLTAKETKTVEIGWPDIEVTGLGSDCTVKRLTEVSFSGDDKLPSDWVS